MHASAGLKQVSAEAELQRVFAVYACLACAMAEAEVLRGQSPCMLHMRPQVLMHAMCCPAD